MCIRDRDGYDQIQQKMNKQASLNKRVQAQLGTLSNLWEAMTGTEMCIRDSTNMSDPMKELEAAIESGRFHHDGNPIMTWCIGNVVGKTCLLYTSRCV